MFNVKLERLYGYIFIILTALTTIIIPSIIYFSIMSNLSSQEDFNVIRTKIFQFIIISIILGFLTTFATLLAYFFEPFLSIRLILLVLAEILYSVDIIVWSGFGALSLETSSSYISLNQSIFFFYFLVIPLLFGIKSFYDFKITRDKWRDCLIVLKTICFMNKKVQNSNQVVKTIRTLNIKKELINKTVQNIRYYLRYLENRKFINRSSRFNLTKEGKKILSKLEKIKMYEEINFAFFKYQKLEEWTEEDFRR
ncbi:MAG: hypothetical protein HWN80_18345 [Candidatus Lokiarchaeota archaeon]|nr:hypothetical protein [Candidatus Lokiarchaeota archaeon]